MSLDKITARLYSDSERECAELVRKATEDAKNLLLRHAERAFIIVFACARAERRPTKNLLLSASEEACALVSAEKESAEKDAETIIEKARSAASASERRAVLKAKSELIETVLLSAKKQLLALDDEKYFELLVYLAKKNLRDDKGTLCMSDEDIKRCPADFASRLGGNVTVSQARLFPFPAFGALLRIRPKRMRQNAPFRIKGEGFRSPFRLMPKAERNSV